LIQDALELQDRSVQARSKVFRAKACMFRNPGKHPRPYLFAIMKSEHKVRIARTVEDLMRTTCLSLHLPAQSK
jgi:hypothetical protein